MGRPRFRIFLNAVIAVLVLLATRGIHGQAAPQSSAKVSRILAITVSGSTQFPADQIIAASGLKAGDIVSVEQIQGATNRLADLGLFKLVNYRYTPRGDSINLEFLVQEAPTVPVEFDNFPWFSDDEIAAAVRKDVGLFNGNVPTSGTLLDAITFSMERLLRARNIKGDVTHQVVLRPVGDGMMVQFRLEGSSLMVHSVQLEDSLAATSERLKDRIGDIQGHPYSRFSIELFEHEQILPLYQAAGHFQVKLGPPESHVSSPDGSADGGAVDLVIPIVPGPVYTWDGATWQGNLLYPSAKLDALIGIKSGEPADGGRIEDSWQRVIQEYGRLGYLDTTVFPQPVVDESTHHVSYRVMINEGAQYHMGELILTGLSPDAERLLLRAWQIPYGQIFDNEFYQSLIKLLVKPSVQVFGDYPIHYTKFGHLLRPDSTIHKVDVLLDFQ